MTKIDPTPLIAEAQARETALRVALDKIERMDRILKHSSYAVFLAGLIGVLCGIAVMWALS